MKLPLAILYALGTVACTSASPPANDGVALPSEKVPPSNPKARSVPLKSIPEAFQGTWANSAADCAPGMQTRLVITANELQFLESYGAITRVQVYSPTHIQTFGKFEGEGETWHGKPEFHLVNGHELSMVVDGASQGKNRVKCQ